MLVMIFSHQINEIKFSGVISFWTREGGGGLSNLYGSPNVVGSQLFKNNLSSQWLTQACLKID